jgi:hypothetical protein
MLMSPSAFLIVVGDTGEAQFAKLSGGGGSIDEWPVWVTPIIKTTNSVRYIADPPTNWESINKKRGLTATADVGIRVQQTLAHSIVARHAQVTGVQVAIVRRQRVELLVGVVGHVDPQVLDTGGPSANELIFATIQHFRFANFAC